MNKKKIVSTAAVVCGVGALVGVGITVPQGGDTSPSQEQQSVAGTVDEFYMTLYRMDLSLDEEEFSDVMDNGGDSEHYPEIREQFESVADEFFTDREQSEERESQFYLSLATMTELMGDLEEPPFSVPAEHVEFGGDRALAHVLLAPQELSEEAYESTEDFDDYEGYVDWTIESGNADSVELTEESGEWLIVNY